MNPATKLEIAALLERAHKARYPERYVREAKQKPDMDAAFDALHEAVRLLVPNEFADARATMAREFQDKEPGTVYHSYWANVCMLLHDRYKDRFRGMDEIEQLATQILNLIFEQ